MTIHAEKSVASKGGRHAIVMGGSMAGLVAARVLTDHFDTVTLIERDEYPNKDISRKGAPQGNHPHALLAKGYRILTQLFPDLPRALEEGGAVMIDMGADFRWYHSGGYRVRADLDLRGPFMSRPFLERLVRERVQSLPNLRCLSESRVAGLVWNDRFDRVTGVRLERIAAGAGIETLSADLVVDATGRGSRTPAWLEELGYTRPYEESIPIDAGYTTLLYPRHPDDLPDAKAAYISPTPPHDKRSGALFPIEGNRWIVTLGGWLNHHAPAHQEGFLEFARQMPVPDIYNVIVHKEPLSAFMTFKFPANLRRRYELLDRFPDGYLVLGDALCSFNPIYGQGMTVCAMTAMTLEECLRTQRPEEKGFPIRFFQQVAKVVDTPWRVAAGADFRFPEVEGRKSPETDLINRYLGWMDRATHTDVEVYRAFAHVMQMLRPAHTLFAPSIVYRVLRANLSWRNRADAARLALRIGRTEADAG
jgi:2-polyprenyl-6-methoxyphenol hydroxylase-like FAD-dependent oxidoreductase